MMIALIDFVISSLAAAGTVMILNMVLRNKYGVLITLFDFGVRQIGIILGISLISAFAATLFPVIKITKKNPVDAINDR